MDLLQKLRGVESKTALNGETLPLHAMVIYEEVRRYYKNMDIAEFWNYYKIEYPDWKVFLDKTDDRE